MNKISNELPEQFSDILLVLDQEKKEIRAVKGLDKAGKLETTVPKEANQKEFLKVDKHGDILSNFLSNYFRQAKDPTRFRFFQVPKKQVEQIAKVLREHIKSPTKAIADMLKTHEVDTSKYNLKNKENMDATKNIEVEDAQEASSQTMTENNGQNEQNPYRYKEENIDWETLSNLGITKEKLEKRNLLDGLLKGYKTNELVPVSFNVGTAFSRLDARLSLQKDDEGKVTMAIHGIRRKPMLDFPFFGHKFSNEDKGNLLKTGNMGRVVDLKNLKTDEMMPSIISVDKLTNELIALKAEYIKIPNEIKGITLTDVQKQTLQEGKPLYLEGMLSRKGTLFDATVQFNADKRYVEFLFDNARQNKQQKQGTGSKEIPKVIRGKELTDEQIENLKNGQTIYSDGFISKTGKVYTGYLSYTGKNGKIDFSFSNPNKKEDTVAQESSKSQDQGQEETPKKKGLKV